MAANGDYREYCLSLKGRECDVCGSTENVVVHHLDGDRSNNELDNLIPVCRAHHAQIHHGMEGLEEYTAQLPESAMFNQGNGAGRKHMSLQGDIFKALKSYKQESESWTDFCARILEYLEMAEDTDDPITGAHMGEFAAMVADKTADRVEERMRRR